MKKVNSFLVSVICICFSSATAFAQLTSPQIDVLMESALTKFKVAGASIAVVKDGKIIHLK